MNVINELEGKFALHKTHYLEYYGIFKILEVNVYLKTNWLADSMIRVSIRGEKTPWMSSDEFVVSDSIEELEAIRDRLLSERIFNRLTFQVNV